MASSRDVDNITSVSCKDLGSSRYHMGSAFIAMVDMLHALHSLWVSLLPFLMLWWNVMLCATCAKYYSWNRFRFRLRLPIAGRRLYSDIMQEAGSFAEAPNTEGSLICSHQRGSCADAWHAEKREMSILSFSQTGSCVEAFPQKDPHFGVFIQAFPQQRGLHKENRQQQGSSLQDDHVGVCDQAFPHQRGSLERDAYVDAAAPCMDELGPCLLNQLEELVSCETTSIDSPAEATASDISKLSSLCFLDGRGPQKSRFLKASQWAACSTLLPNQVPSLDICRHPLNPQKHSWLQLSLLKNGDMLHLKFPMLSSDFSINWSILQQWLQFHNGCPISCVAALICGKDVDYAASQLVLPNIGGIDITSIVSLAIAFKGAMEDVVESTIRESSNLLLHESRTSVASVDYTCHHDNENSDDGYDWMYGVDDQPKYERDYGLKNEDENSGSGNREDLGSTSLQSDDGCDGVYGIGVGAMYDRHDGVDVIHHRQLDGDEIFCRYNRYHDADDSGEDSGDVYGGFVHSNDEADGLQDRSFYSDVGDGVPHCVEDVDGIYGRQLCDAGDGVYDGESDFDDDGPRCAKDVDGIYGWQNCDAGDGLYDGDSDFEDDVEDKGDVFSDVDFIDDNGLYGSALEMKELHTAYSWWDKDAVVVDRQEGEEESREQAWQEGEEETMEQAWQVV